MLDHVVVGNQGEIEIHGYLVVPHEPDREPAPVATVWATSAVDGSELSIVSTISSRRSRESLTLVLTDLVAHSSGGSGACPVAS
jgi:hypothetical protein